MFPFRLGRRPRDDPQRGAADALKARLRTQLLLAPEDELSLSEIVCGDPNCPGTETVILVLRKGERTVALKLPGPLAEVDDEEIARLRLPPRGPSTGWTRSEEPADKPACMP